MAYLPLRPVDIAGNAHAAYEAWVSGIDGELDRPDCDRNELCRRILTELHYPQLTGVDPATLPEATRVALLSLDPRNVTLEPEYYWETDLERYAAIKPLIWLWEMFDKSPVGENVHLGILFRRVLARRIFASCGQNLKIFHHVNKIKCGDAFDKYIKDPLVKGIQNALGYSLARCGLGLVKGFGCGIIDSIFSTAETLCASIETCLRSRIGRFAGGVAAIFPPLLTTYAAGCYVATMVPRIKSAVGCLSQLMSSPKLRASRESIS